MEKAAGSYSLQRSFKFSNLCYSVMYAFESQNHLGQLTNYIDCCQEDKQQYGPETFLGVLKSNERFFTQSSSDLDWMWHV